MNTINQIEKHFAVEFSKMNNKDLYAWLKANHPTTKVLTGRTKAQLYADIGYIMREQLEAKEDAESEDMQANDTNANANPFADSESEDEDKTECSNCGCDMTEEDGHTMDNEQVWCDDCYENDTEECHGCAELFKIDTLNRHDLCSPCECKRASAPAETDAEEEERCYTCNKPQSELKSPLIYYENPRQSFLYCSGCYAEDDQSVASEVRADSIPEDPCAKCKRNMPDCECEADFFASDDDTPVANMPEEQIYGLAYATIANLQAQVAELQAQLQDAKDDNRDMVASLKGIIGNQQYRDQSTAEAQPPVREIPVRKTAPKPKAKAPATVVEQPEGKRYTYKRPMTYEGDYCKKGMVVEMRITRLWVKGVAMRLAYYPSPEGNWVGLNAQWRGRRFLNLQRASTECCEKNQIANSPNAWSAFRCINTETDEFMSIERLDKHPNWADCKVLMDDGYWNAEENADEDEDA